MKRRIISLLFLFLLFLLVFVSCGTSVVFSSYVPSEVNIYGKKTVAFAPTKPYDKYNHGKVNIFMNLAYDSGYPTPYALETMPSLEDPQMYVETAEYVTRKFCAALDQGVYKIISPKLTEKYIRSAKNTSNTVRSMLRAQKIDILVSTYIDRQIYTEDVTCIPHTDKKGVVHYSYYIEQSADLNVYYTVQDVNTMEIIDTGTLKASYPKSSANGRFYIGEMVEDSYFPDDGNFENPKVIFEDMADSLAEKFKKRLTPYKQINRLTLVKSENKKLEEAYKLVEDGQYSYALDMFLTDWKKNADFASGYNASILYVVTDGYDKALELISQVFVTTKNEKAAKLRNTIQALNNMENAAKRQIAGEKLPDNVRDTAELIGY